MLYLRVYVPIKVYFFAWYHLFLTFLAFFQLLCSFSRSLRLGNFQRLWMVRACLTLIGYSVYWHIFATIFQDCLFLVFLWLIRGDRPDLIFYWQILMELFWHSWPWTWIRVGLALGLCVFWMGFVRQPASSNSHLFDCRGYDSLLKNDPSTCSLSTLLSHSSLIFCQENPLIISSDYWNNYSGAWVINFAWLRHFRW